MTDAPRNIPVPDQFAACEQIKALRRMSGVKEALIANPDIRVGANWLAEVKGVETNRVDIKELRAMHKDLVEEYTFPRRPCALCCRGSCRDGEIVSARSMRSAEKSGDTQ